MYKQRIATIEHQARAEIITKLLWTVRQARPERQTEILRQRLETMDARTRQAVYAALTDTELAGLCGPGITDYLAQCSDMDITAMAQDSSLRAAEQGYRHYQQWRKQGGRGRPAFLAAPHRAAR